MSTSAAAPHILVVDDEEMIIDLLGDYFSGLGYGVSVAASAEEAIEKLNNGNTFNLILTDVNLPGRSGLELLKIVAETKDDLPVILLTGLKTLDTAVSALKSGASDYITKPFDLITVRKIVEKVLYKRTKSLKKDKVYENLQHLKAHFQFTTSEMNPGILAKELSMFLQKMHFGTEDEIRQFELAFTETFINAVEHGNLELSSKSKESSILEITEFEEEKERRLNDPAFAERQIAVSFECNPELFCLTVKDDGPGFDWKRFTNQAHRISGASLDPHGRGFMIIRHLIDEVHFNPAGNVITLIKNRMTNSEGQPG